MTAQLSLTPAPFPHRWAELSPCKRYRYVLGHRWAPGPTAVFALCNPSTADAERDDATSRKCDGFAKRWGGGARIIVNVCAWRATDPSALLPPAVHPDTGCSFDPVGADNALWLGAMLGQARIEAFAAPAPVVFGWGDALPKALRQHARRVHEQARRHAIEPQCLGTTRSGQPRHPLMLSYATPLERWEPRP